MSPDTQLERALKSCFQPLLDEQVYICSLASCSRDKMYPGKLAMYVVILS